MKIRSAVARVPAAESAVALAHFEQLMTFETDCWDVHHAMTHRHHDFVLMDVRSPEFFASGHVPGAVNLPHPKISEKTLDEYGEETLFVVYCAGPHCNGAHKGAQRLARLGRPVKVMIGGVEGWKDEGFSLSQVDEP